MQFGIHTTNTTILNPIDLNTNNAFNFVIGSCMIIEVDLVRGCPYSFHNTKERSLYFSLGLSVSGSLQEMNNERDQINNNVALERCAKPGLGIFCKGSFKRDVLCSFSNNNTTKMTTRDNDNTTIDQVIICKQLITKNMPNKKRNRRRNKLARLMQKKTISSFKYHPQNHSI